ncbi:hypothetical protein ACFYKX_23880 [Cytobacillus sp. FJAT-54145]|uniref:Uncharacterized protein n=1 Tax=Cytobacillus spartinae TaxID=3299023 RepID=A0ABW6KK75_9BACI
MKKLNKLEAVLWNVALPGFSQLLTGRIIVGFLFLVLEIVINVNSRFNVAIIHSFHWEISKAIHVVDYQWLMFYPCLYMYAMWDAYRHAMPETEKYSYLPFVFGAYFVTVGLIYSTTLRLFGVMFGPVFLPMLFLIPGLLIGGLIRYFLLKSKTMNQA